MKSTQMIGYNTSFRNLLSWRDFVWANYQAQNLQRVTLNERQCSFNALFVRHDWKRYDSNCINVLIDVILIVYDSKF